MIEPIYECIGRTSRLRAFSVQFHRLPELTLPTSPPKFLFRDSRSDILQSALSSRLSSSSIFSFILVFSSVSEFARSWALSSSFLSSSFLNAQENEDKRHGHPIHCVHRCTVALPTKLVILLQINSSRFRLFQVTC